MDLQLAGRTAVVTGASRGIGLATVRTLTDEGMRVVAASRTVTPELKETGAHTVSVDLATPDGPARLIEQAVAEVGGIDLLVNNAGGGDGGAEHTRGFLAVGDADWRSLFDLNLLAAVRASRAALPHLVRGGGSLVNISSVGARMPHNGPLAYNTAKAALTAFGKGLVQEFGPQGVRVNTISPAATRTSLWDGPNSFGAAVAETAGVTQADVIAQLPESNGMVTGRLVEPAEVAGLVAYLASPLAASIVGVDYVVDGGTLKTV